MSIRQKWLASGHLWLLSVITHPPDTTRHSNRKFCLYFNSSPLLKWEDFLIPSYCLLLVLQWFCLLWREGRGQPATDPGAGVLFSTLRDNDSKIAIIGSRVFVSILKLSFQNILFLVCCGGAGKAKQFDPKPEPFLLSHRITLMFSLILVMSNERQALVLFSPGIVPQTKK